MKIGSKVKDKDTLEVGKVVELSKTGIYARVEFPDGRTVIRQAGQFILITFFEWLWAKLFGSDKKVV